MSPSTKKFTVIDVEVATYLFVCEKMKNELPFGIGFVLFLPLTSDIRRGLAPVVSSFSQPSSISISSSDSSRSQKRED